MASLYAYYQKDKRWKNPKPELIEIYEAVNAYIAKFPPWLVNVQPIVEALVGSRVDFDHVSWDATPCHTNLWLEWINKFGLRNAYLVSRIDIPAVRDVTDVVPSDAQFLLRITPFDEYQGTARQFPAVTMFINRLGEFLFDSCKLESFYEPNEYTPEIQADEIVLFKSCVYIVGEILTMMNTRGTRVEPPFDKPPAQVVKPNRHPHSVWHTIHLPKFLEEPMGLETSGEVVERREHWVRAHRADYRQGKGLFGRIHGLIWVPEHKRGNPELGTVKQSFAVHSLPERVQP